MLNSRKVISPASWVSLSSRSVLSERYDVELSDEFVSFAVILCLALLCDGECQLKER